ncbi:8ed333a9-7deb-4f0d-aaa1-9d85ef541d10 [Sclerotinia trifoliorum]|uniref:8ed333a9-7deb-4f0d-aaa1-9d85ef541d10 n=1 Tax=Sclerotinia trifoliorum TaxID=28548 RepID=A0A8H2VYE4_9HELO|nr:8ed333a9-7deb-4f0d-aaa1-9d85ef541d10 [Sclerotinia trifoliorum]
MVSNNIPRMLKRSFLSRCLHLLNIHTACRMLIELFQAHHRHTTPSQLKKMTLAEAGRICLDYTSTGVEIIQKHFRKSCRSFNPFIHSNAKYVLEGEAESRVIDYANNSEDTVKACIAKQDLSMHLVWKRGHADCVNVGRTFIDLPQGLK